MGENFSKMASLETGQDNISSKRKIQNDYESSLLPK